jgi:HNH endonuclease
MRHCLACGCELVARHKKRFCSVACQRALERRKNIERWLESGYAPYVRGGNHYTYLHLLDEQSGRCASCGVERHWNGPPLTLIVDHLDGDASNNRRENLRLVCPNCDSQLPTFKARNRGNGRAWRRQRYADGKSY